MELQKVLSERRSIRRYKNSSIPQNDIETIIQAAQEAPSWKNSQTARYENFIFSVSIPLSPFIPFPFCRATQKTASFPGFRRFCHLNPAKNVSWVASCFPARLCRAVYYGRGGFFKPPAL